MVCRASYRDLLSTASSIISMDQQMHDVESLMSHIGQKCNTRIIERKSSNLHTFNNYVSVKDNARYAFTSQLAVLKSCPDVIASIVKTGGSLLLAAKVLLVSRLLHTKLSKRTHPPPYLETLRGRLARLRGRLLGKSEQRFRSLDAGREELVEAMCAFALATSSSTQDVVIHFQTLRLEAIQECIVGGKENPQGNLLTALRLYVKSLQDTKAIVPGQLSSALQSLKATPIFRSKELQGLVDMNLDIHDGWMGEDIKGFTPYIRHDDLNRTHAEKMLKAWAKTAVGKFLEGLKMRVQDISEATKLMSLRREVLELWLGQHRHSFGVDASEVLDGLRAVFNERAVELVKQRVRTLGDVGGSMIRTIKEDWQYWQDHASNKLTTLWSPTVINMDISNGARAFRQKLMDVMAGKHEVVLDLCRTYLNWREEIRTIENVIIEAKRIRWVENIDDVDNDDDLLDDKQTLLSEDDPALLQEALRDGLEEAFTNLNKVIQILVSELDQERDVDKAIIILRILRDIRGNIPASSSSIEVGRDVIPILFAHLAASTLILPLQRSCKRFSRFLKVSTLPTRMLWEGEPEVPVLPSPWSYRLLLEITQSMADLGADIWSPEAVKALKESAAAQLLKRLQDIPASADLEENTNGVVNGKANAGEADTDHGSMEEPEENPDSKEGNDATQGSQQPNGSLTNGSHPSPTNPALEQQKATQQLFDVLYLSNALAVDTDTSESGLEQLQGRLIGGIELEAKSIERMRKGAAEYWKRTGLLFGLLA